MEKELEQYTNPSDYLDDFKEPGKVSKKKPKQTTNDDTLSQVLSKGAPIFRGYNTGVGKSSFDDGIMWDHDITLKEGQQAFQDQLEDYRSNNQGWFLKALAAPNRMTLKIASEAAKIPGYLGGIIGGTIEQIEDGITGKDNHNFLETATNNTWIKGIQQINDTINEEYLPVYVKKSVKEGNLWDNVSSIDFLATEGADGIGFMASMMIPGAIIKGLGLGSKMANGFTKLLSTGNKAPKLAKVLRGVEKLGVKLSPPSAAKLDILNATVANTYLESAAETGNALESFDKNKDAFIANLVTNQGLTIEEATKEFNNQKGILGQNILLTNVALLIIPNALQSAIMFGKPASKFLNSYTTKDALKNAGKRIIQNTFSEGFIEEAGQTTVETFFKDKAIKGELTGGFKDFDPAGLKDAYLNTISSVDGQKAVFLGAVLGSGASLYKGRKEDKYNKKKSDEVKSLTQRYDATLQALTNTDSYKKDSDGNILYDYNNKPIVNKKALIEKFKTIDSLSNRFAEYDEALKSGNEELLEKARNKTIQDVILPFVQQGELGIEGLSQYYDKMLELEDIASSESFEDIKSRKAEIMEYTKDVSKKFEKYLDFSNSKFNLNIKTNTKEDAKLLFEAKKQYLQQLSGSYALAEIERNQVKQKLDKVNKEIEYLEDINKVNTVTIDEANSLNYEQGYEDTIKNNKKESLKNKNKDYKNLIEYKQRLEKKFTKVEEEIANNYFDIKKIEKDFKNKNKDNIKVEESTPQSTSSQTEDNEEETPLNEEGNKVTAEDFQNTSTTTYQNNKPSEEEQIDEDINNEDIKNIIIDIKNNSQLNTKEKLVDYINNLEISEELKQGILLELTDLFDNLPTEEEINEQEKQIDVELEGLNKEELAKSDIAEDIPFEDTYVEPVTQDIETGKGFKLMSLNKAFEPIFSILKQFVKYEKTPRDKKNDNVSFSLGDFTNNDSNIKQIWDKVKKGEKINKNQINLLEEYLPIKVTLTNPNDSKDSGFTFFNTVASDKTIFNERERPLRKAIIEALIENKGDFNSFKGSIQGQGKGKLNLDLNSYNNPVIELSVIKNLSKKEQIKYFQKNTFIVNMKGELINLSTNQPTTRSFIHGLKNLKAGDTFLLTTRPNGEEFALKLNTNRISLEKANALVKLIAITSSVIKGNIEIKGNFNDFIKNSLGKEALQLSNELELIKKYNGTNIDKLNKLINYNINSQNNNEVSKFFLDSKGDLVLGSLIYKVNKDLRDNEGQMYHQNTDQYGFIGFINSLLNEFIKDNKELTPNQIAAKQNLINFLTHKKYHVTKEFSNPEYIEHVFGMNNTEALLSTNVDVNKDMFEGYSNIFLNNDIIKLNKEEEIPTKKFEGYPVEDEQEEDNEVTLEDILALDKPQQSSIEAKKADIERRRQAKLEENKKLSVQDLKTKVADEFDTLEETRNKLKQEVFNDASLSSSDKELLTTAIDGIFDIPGSNPYIIDDYEGYAAYDPKKFEEYMLYNFPNLTKDQIKNVLSKNIEQIATQHNASLLASLEGPSGLPNNLAELNANKINAKYDAELAALESENKSSNQAEKNNIKGTLTQQGTSVELEIKGDTGKEFLLTVDRKGNISLFSEKQSDGSYKTGEVAPKEAVNKLYNKYVPEKTRIAITNWLNSFNGSWAASETQDGKNYTKAEENLNKELKALESENNLENISEKEWNDFVDNNNVSERILNIIANKIINNESFSVKEQAIHSSNVSKIENILNNIRNSQKNSVSLQEDEKVVINAINDNIEFDKLSDVELKNFNAITIKTFGQQARDLIKSLNKPTIKEIADKLKTLYSEETLKETVKTICNI